MFNFASKLINTIGDLVSVEEPPPTTTPGQQHQQPPFSNQPRRSSGDARIFQQQQQQKPRFHGPLSAPDLNFRSGAGGPTRETRPSAPVYRYPSGPNATSYGSANYSSGNYTPITTVYGSSTSNTFGPTTTTSSSYEPSSSTFGTTSSTSYRPERYEENTFKTPDIDYNEDGYNVGGNFNNNDRQSYISDIQKEYGIYREHDNNDSKDFEDDDRYSLGYGNETRRKRSLNENTQLNNTNDCDNSTYRTLNTNYFNALNDQHSVLSTDTNFYENRDHQFQAAESFDPSSKAECKFGTNDVAQFSNTNLWTSENDYHKQRWKNDENTSEGKGKVFRPEQDDKNSSPLSQEDDAKNSSRSESESSDEISFGEALATGLIPPHITPEMAARMNIELINHPKGVIESFYGHSPGEVYTIPEEEDEICSPTGADGVTSLRKQRIASARMETSANINKDVQNQRRMNPINQPEQKYKFNAINSSDSCNNPDQRLRIDESKVMRMAYKDGETVNVVQKIEPSLNVQFLPDQVNIKQQFRHLPPQQSFERAQPYQQDRPENKASSQQHVIPDPRSQLTKPQENVLSKIQRQDSAHNPAYYVDSRPPQPYPENRPAQNYPVDHKPRQMYSTDNRPPQPLPQDNGAPQSFQASSQNYQFDNRLQQHPPDKFSENWAPQQSNLTDNRQQSFTVDNRQSALDNRPLQSNYPADNATMQNSYYGNTRQPPYASDRIPQQPYVPDNRFLLKIADNRPPQGYTTDSKQMPSNYNKIPEYDNRPPQGYQQTFRAPQQGYSNENKLPPGYQNAPQQQRFNDYRLPAPEYPDRLQRHPNENRPQGPYPPDNRQNQQESCTDNRQMMQGYSENRQIPAGYPPVSQIYYADGEAPQQAFVDSQLPHRYPADNQKTYSSPETRRLNQQSQQHSRQELQQRQMLNQGYQQEQQQRPAYRENNQDRRSQNFQHGDFQDPNNRGMRRQPERQDSLPSDPPHRKRFPLRKYNSEERYSSFQQEYERRRCNSQTYDSPGEEYDSPGRSPQARSRQRSSSLDSHERNERHYSKGRSRYQEYNKDDEDYENQNRRTGESRRTPRMSHEKNVHPKQMQRNPVGHTRSPMADRVRKTAQWTDDVSGEDNKPRSTERRLPHIEPRKGVEFGDRNRTLSETKRKENFCPQHKKFVSNATDTARPTRRLLPKEPVGQPLSRRTIKRQTQDKSTITSKSEDSAHQKAGILSTAARKVERGGNLKISFSDPISNLSKSNKGIPAITRTDHSTKSQSTKPDKPLISSNLISQSKNFVYPTNNVVEKISPSSVSFSPLFRIQPDTTIKDTRLLSSPSARSMPIPIANRTRSLDRYSSSETNLNISPFHHDQFSRPGSAPGLMYEPVPSTTNTALQLSLYEMHALKKEEKFWSDIYSALPADMKHLIANRGIGSVARKVSGGNNTNFPSVNSFPTNVSGMSGSAPERMSLENRIMQRALNSKAALKSGQTRDTLTSSLGERIGNRLRILHEMKEQATGFGNRRKSADALSRRSASDGEYSFSSSTNFPLHWHLVRRPHSDSAIDLLERLDIQNSPTRVSGSAYNSSEYLTKDAGCFKIVDKSQSYLTSPSTNVPPSPAPSHPIRLRDTALRADHVESSACQRAGYCPGVDNRSGFFSCLQNIESLTRQYEEEDHPRSELDLYEDEIYSDSGYGRYSIHPNHRKHIGHPNRRHYDRF